MNVSHDFLDLVNDTSQLVHRWTYGSGLVTRSSIFSEHVRR